MEIDRRGSWQEKFEQLFHVVEASLGPRESSFGLAINLPCPEPIRALQQFAGNWPSRNEYYEGIPIFHVGDHLLIGEDIVVEGDRIKFFSENQSLWDCWTRFDEDDGTVFVNGVDLEREMVVADRLSDFLVTYALLSVVFSMKSYSKRAPTRAAYWRTPSEWRHLWSGPFVFRQLNFWQHEGCLVTDVTHPFRYGTN